MLKREFSLSWNGIPISIGFNEFFRLVKRQIYNVSLSAVNTQDEREKRHFNFFFLQYFT